MTFCLCPLICLCSAMYTVADKSSFLQQRFHFHRYVQDGSKYFAQDPFLRVVHSHMFLSHSADEPVSRCYGEDMQTMPSIQSRILTRASTGK